MRARSALSAAHLPTTSLEEWKYTNLARALGEDLISLAPLPIENIFIHSSGGQNGGKVEDRLWMGMHNTHSQPCLKIVVEDDAELVILERHSGVGTYWKNMTSEIVIGKRSRLHHIRLQEDSIDSINTNMVLLTLEQESSYHGFTLNTGAKLVRHDVNALVLGQNSHCIFNGINLLKGLQHCDTTIVIEHQAPNCKSNQFFRSLLDGQSRCVFQGKVHVHRAAQKTDAYQLSNAILLSDRAEMDTKPELEIYADDVKCTHGATTGQFDEEPLFYLQSRGLTEAEARKVLMTAFVNEVVGNIEDESNQALVSEKVQTWLANR